MAKKLPAKALTKGTVYPVVKKVAAHLGARMTKQIFLPMAKRLQKHLASLELTKPRHRPEGTGTVAFQAGEDEGAQQLGT